MSEPVDPVNLSLTVASGYAVLTLDEEYRYSAYTTSNALRSLAATVATVAEAPETAACRWTDESGGHYIDLVHTPAHTLSFVLHEFPEPRNNTYAEYFSARRGDVAAARHYDLRKFLTTLVLEHWKLRVFESDQFGFIPSWGWVFPQREFDNLCRIAESNYGFKLPSTQEIIDERH